MTGTTAEDLLRQLTGAAEDALGMVDKHNAMLTPAAERYLLVDVRLDELKSALRKAAAHLRKPAEQPAAPRLPVAPRSLVLWRARRWPLRPQLVGVFPNRNLFIKWVGTAWNKPGEYVTVHAVDTGKQVGRYDCAAQLLAAPLEFVEQPLEPAQPKAWGVPDSAF